MERFIQAKPILDTLKRNGHEAYFVGGAVRDYILNRPIHDIDIATSAKPEIVQALFKSVIPVGVEHGTVIVVVQDVPYEVTTFRKESEYKDYRRPNNVEFVSNLHEDLKRRDFTMNAIAMTSEFTIIDPFNGQLDIRNKLIRTVGSPHERFEEDPLRMLRAIRFVSGLNFSIEENTMRAIDKMKPYLAHLSVERIAQEFEKLFLGQANNKALNLIASYEINSYLPCLHPFHKQLRKIAQLRLTLLKEICECWALLLYKLKLEPRKFLKAWKQPNKIIKQTEKLLYALKLDESERWNRYQFYSLGWELSLSYIRVLTIIHEENFEDNVANLTKLYHSLPIKSRQELAINGNDLVDILNQKPGPWLKKALYDIEKSIIDGKLNNNKSEIREWVKKWDSQFEKNC